MTEHVTDTIERLDAEIEALEAQLETLKNQRDAARQERRALIKRKRNPNNMLKRSFIKAQWGTTLERLLREFAEDGLTKTQTAKVLGYHPDTIGKLAKRYQIAFRDGRGGFQWKSREAAKDHLDKIRPQRKTS